MSKKILKIKRFGGLNLNRIIKLKHKYPNKNKKGQNKKIMILLSYSVLLPERFFLEN